MTKQKIKQAAKEANAYGYPNFNGEKHEAFNDGFLAGANFVNEKQPYSAQEMYLNMQYYMEYCEMKGYVTPQDWIEKHKHF